VKTFPQPGALTLLIAIVITCLLLFLFQKLIWLVVPFLLALMFYYCLRPVVSVLVLRGMSHEAASRTVWLLLQIATAAALIASTLFVAKHSGAWHDDFDRYALGGRNMIVKSIVSVEKMIPPLQEMNLSTQAEQRLQQVSDRFTEKWLLPIALLLFKCLPSMVLVPYLAYFMLIDDMRLKKYLVKSVPNAFFEKALLLFSRLDASLQNYFMGLLQLTMLDTLCLGIGLAVLGIHGAIWLGLAAAVLAWIPYIGSLASAVLVVVIAATDFPEKTWMAYACLILFAVVRVLDDFVFLPATIGRKLHLHPALSVMMLVLGATFAGVTGLILILPLFGIVMVVSEAVAHVLSDPKLKARYKASQQLAVAAVSKSLQ
jgi:predicted PurR-regulated permease PerM